MKLLCTGLLSFVILLYAPVTALADSKPKGAKPAGQKKIEKAYTGYTQLWDKNCAGGIYFAQNNQVRAWCAEGSGKLGAGAWSVDNQGRLCSKLTWYWLDGNRTATSAGDEKCISHVVDGWGRMWRSWNGSTWWLLHRRSGSIVRGYKFKSNVEVIRRKLSL